MVFCSSLFGESVYGRIKFGNITNRTRRSCLIVFESPVFDIFE